MDLAQPSWVGLDSNVLHASHCDSRIKKPELAGVCLSHANDSTTKGQAEIGNAFRNPNSELENITWVKVNHMAKAKVKG